MDRKYILLDIDGLNGVINVEVRKGYDIIDEEGFGEYTEEIEDSLVTTFKDIKKEYNCFEEFITELKNEYGTDEIIGW